MDKQKLKEFISKLLAIDVKNLNDQQLAEHMAMVKQARSLAEGYTVTRGIDKERYQERQGLEGPFSTKSGKVVYYDKVEGKYYDPDTDMYIEYEDWQAMNEGNLERKELGNGRTQYIRKSSSYTDDGGSSIPGYSVNAPKRGVEDENEREFNFRDDDLDEAQEDAFMSSLKGLKTWQVVIRNNYYNGKYSDYSGRYFYVLATSAEEAKQVVLDNADAILQDLLAMKSHNGKKILPRGKAVRITPDRIGKIEDGTVAGRMSTTSYKKMYSPQGVMMVKLTNGAISDVQGQEQGVEEAALTTMNPRGEKPFKPNMTAPKKKYPAIGTLAWEKLPDYVKKELLKKRGHVKEQGVAEGGFKNLYAEFSGYGNYMQGRAVNVFKKAGLEIVSKDYSEDEDIQTYIVKGDRWSIEKAGEFLERNPEQYGGYHFVKQEVVEAIPYALSAANANAEYERTRTHLGGYKGRVDTEVGGKDEYFAVMKALQRAAKQAGQHVECGLSDNKMSIFSDTMDSDTLDKFVDDVLEQGLDEAVEDTVRFVLHSERAYEAVMDRMGDLIDWDEFDYMKVPSRLWPKVQQIAADADGLGAEDVDDSGPEDNPEHYGVNEEISTEAYNRLKRVFDFSDYKG